MSAPVFVLVAFGPTGGSGNFTTAHGLSHTPYGIEILPTAATGVWLQSVFVDGTNIYATAAGAGAAGKFRVW